MSPEDVVQVGDRVPGILEQSRMRGWKAGFFDFVKAESDQIEFFNPGLVRQPDGLWLIVRASELVDGMPYGKNKIWACRLNEKNKTPEGGPLLVFPDSGEEEQFEDPRAVFWNDQTWIGCSNFTWYPDGSWTGAHQCLGIFRNNGMQGQEDARWTALARRDPPVGTNLDRSGHTNGRHNKNWLWFFHEGKLHLIYTSDPWEVVEFGAGWDDQIKYEWEGMKWNYGTVRGGTPPILVGDLYYTFFHSSVPWRGRFRRYHMGALAFEAKPPFKPVMWTREPLLSGSQNDPWHQQKPLVVFPCGAVLENDRWFISMGINDLKCAWVDIPHEDVVKAVEAAPEAPALSLLAAPTERIQYAHVPFQMGQAENPSAQESSTAGVMEALKVIIPAIPRTPESLPPRPPPLVVPPSGDRVYKPELLGNSDAAKLRPLVPDAVAETFQAEPEPPPLAYVPPRKQTSEKMLAILAAGRAKMLENRRLGIIPKYKKRKRRKKKR